MQSDLINIVAIGLGLAFIFGAIANRLRLSPLVGYLAAGFCAGPFSPGFVGNSAIAQQLADIGIILLMFGVGLHFSIKDLNTVKWTAVPGAIIQIICSSLFGFGLAKLMGWSLLYSVVFGFSLSMASTVVVLRALEERRLLDTPRGKIIMGWLIVEDLSSVLALVMLPVLGQLLGDHTTAVSHGSSDVFKSIGYTLLKLGLFIAIMFIVGRRLIPWILERIASTGSRELFTLSILAIALGVALGSAKLFDVSFALGAFFAGMMLNESEFSHQAANDSLPLRDAFAVLFFVSVGMLFNPIILVEHPFQVFGTAFIIIVGKSFFAFTIMRKLKHIKVKALTVAASLAQIGEFSFIIAGQAVALNVLPKEGQDLILAGALISIIANPFLFGYLDRWQARKEVEALKSTESAEEILEDVLPGPTFVAGGHAIVIGYGQVGSELARVLGEKGVPLVVIDDNDDHINHAHKVGIAAIRGNAANDLVLAEASPHNAKIAVLAIPQAFETGGVLSKLRAINPGITLLARAHSEAEMKYLLEHGADGAILAERELAHSLAEMVMATSLYNVSMESQPNETQQIIASL